MRPALWTLVRRSGLIGAWRRWRRHAVGVLTAHGVMDDGHGTAWQPLWPRLHVDELERTLRALQPHYEFVTLSDAAKMLAGEHPLKPHCMVLTFDDGYRNNYTHALPILERLGIPATLFVCTGMVGTRRSFWIDRLDYVLQQLPEPRRTICAGGEEVVIDFTSRGALAESYLRLRLALKRNCTGDFDRHVEELADRLEREAGRSLSDVIDGDPWASAMSWDDVRSARARGFEIGSHTVDHARLSLADAAVVRDQLTRSLATIRTEVGADAVPFAYPNGDYTASVAGEVRSSGYACAVTGDIGLNTTGDDLYTLRRINFPARQHTDHILGLASGFQAAVAGLRPRALA